MARETTVIRAGEISGGGERGYVDWAAILAGAAIAAGTSIVFAGFATAIGLGSISTEPGEETSGFGLILTALFTAISMAAAYMLGGYIAGRMRRRVDGAGRDEVTARDGIHGLVVWAIGMIIGGMMALGAVSSGAKAVGSAAGTAVEAAGSLAGGVAQGAGNLVGGVGSGAGQLAGGAAQGLGQAAAPALQDMLPEGLQANPLDYLTDSMLRPSTPQPGASDAAMRREAGGIIMNLIRTGEISEPDQAFLRSAVAARTGLSEAEVQSRVNATVEQAQSMRAEAEQRLQEAQAAAEQARAEAEQSLERARQEAVDAAEAARHAGILTAFLLTASALLAAAAAYVGAVRGGRHRDEGTIWGWLSYHQ